MVLGFFSGSRASRARLDHSPQSKAGVRNQWSHTSATHISIHAVDRENFLSYAKKNFKSG